MKASEGGGGPGSPRGKVGGRRPASGPGEREHHGRDQQGRTSAAARCTIGKERVRDRAPGQKRGGRIGVGTGPRDDAPTSASSATHALAGWRKLYTRIECCDFRVPTCYTLGVR